MRAAAFYGCGGPEKIDAETGKITTVAGDGAPGFSGDVTLQTR
jgi:hypothetical protein